MFFAPIDPRLETDPRPAPPEAEPGPADVVDCPHVPAWVLVTAAVVCSPAVGGMAWGLLVALGVPPMAACVIGLALAGELAWCLVRVARE
jgi:hypothetical protein